MMENRSCKNLLDAACVDEKLETEEEFQDHCSKHRLSPPDALLTGMR